MRHATIVAVYRYWDQVRAGMRAPSRSELDPLALAAHLGDVFILEQAEQGPRFRLAGSRFVNAFGRELTGAAFATLFHAESRDVAEYAIETVMASGEPILIGARLVTAGIDAVAAEPDDDMARFAQPAGKIAGRIGLHRRRIRQAGELLLLPLMHQGKLGQRAFGAFAINTPVSDRAARPQAMVATGTRVISAKPAPDAGSALLTAALAEHVISRHGHLTLIRGLQGE